MRPTRWFLTWVGIAVACAAVTAVTPAWGGAQAVAPDPGRHCLTEPPSDRAVTLCREAVRVAPNDADLRRAFAAALSARGDTSAALGELARVLRADPHSARAQL